jgi:predicted secreted protein
MQNRLRRTAAMFGALPFCALLLVAAGCGGSTERGGFAAPSPTPAARPSYTLCDPALLVFCDPSQTITVARGSRVAIVLADSPGTGFRWRIMQQPDSAIVQAPDGGDYQQDPATFGLVPGRGQDVWTFTATGPGKVVVAFQYIGPNGAPSLNPYNSPVFVVVVT